MLSPLLNRRHFIGSFLTAYLRSVAEDFKLNPGAVESISEQPGNSDRILIGYTRGLLVLWNRKTLSADQVCKVYLKELYRWQIY